MNPAEIHKKLLRWYDANRRALPWRRCKDPYRIWISEIMLQQTRVETVIPYYERFLSAFPTVKDLAQADTDKLLNLWAGLGYYSRARNLQAAARQAMEDFGGQLPVKLEDLRSLKGIGAYTSAAIASIAHDAPHAAIDGNLERVFSRLIATRKNPKTDGRAEMESIGQALVNLGRAGDLNQSVMDLASAICLPKEPKCPLCPLRENCAAFAQGIQRELPLKKVKAAPIELQAEGLILIAEESLLLARRSSGQWLSGLWDIPWWIEGSSPPFAAPAGSAQFASCAHLRTITQHKIYFQVRGIRCEGKPTAQELENLPAAELRWVPLREMHGINLPRPSEKALAATLGKLELDLS